MPDTDFDLITFDCYGTLIDWESGIINAFQSEALAGGVSLNPADIAAAYMIEEPIVESGPYQPYREVLANTALAVAVRLGWKLEPERASFLAESVARWRPFPDTNAALEKLASRYSLGILSNIDDDILAQTIEQFSVRFDLIVTAAQVESYKPGHAHFLEAIKRGNGKRILHAAQSYFHDVVPASALGVPAAWVNRRHERADEGGPAPTYEVNTLSELAGVLLG